MLVSRQIQASACIAENRYVRCRAKRRSSSVPRTADSYGGTATRNKFHAKRYMPSPALVAESRSRHTAMPAASIAATAAISLLASRVASRMTETQFRAEMRYQVAIAMAITLFKKGLLTHDEYAAMDAILLDKFRPCLGALLSENALT
ncbi:hypothetical protein SDC9_195563 [bioreactor metagenome]|uniref:SHOCT-like domain-containing protein n=1 Tax=bioreactor metagenome TaxID=1076179 RepID=A0A645IBW7_9ZZZZ